ncbi:MAG: hypothetical protein WC451_02605 [Patescibacteria group bacterium]
MGTTLGELQRSFDGIEKKLNTIEEKLDKSLETQARHDERIISLGNRMDSVDGKDGAISTLRGQIQAWDIKIMGALAFAVVALLGAIWQFILGGNK